MKNTKKELFLGLFVLTILFIMGVFFLFLTGFFKINNAKEFYEYLLNHLFELLASLFFIGVSIYGFIFIIKESLIKSKKETLYLNKKDDDICIFIDEKGKKFHCKDKNYAIGKYYNVLKTANKIEKILEVSISEFEIPKEKISYFSVLYTPYMKYNNGFLILIVYILLIPTILSTILASGYDKIYGILIIAPLSYFILYDLICKIKAKKSKGKEIDDTKLFNFHLTIVKVYNTIMNLILISIMIIINGFLIWLFIGVKDNIARIMFFPFIALLLLILAQLIAGLLDKKNVVNLLMKIYTLIFYLWWFSMLLYMTQKIAINEPVMIVVVIPFWIVGLYRLYKDKIKIK